MTWLLGIEKAPSRGAELVSGSGSRCLFSVNFSALNRAAERIQRVPAMKTLSDTSPQTLCAQIRLSTRPIASVKNRDDLTITAGVPPGHQLIQSLLVTTIDQLQRRGVVGVQACVLGRGVHRAPRDQHHAKTAG